MRKFTDIADFYDYCISILQSCRFQNIQSTAHRIIYIRENFDKVTLNAYFYVGNLPQNVIKVINSKTNILKFSVDNMLKNLIEHPEIGFNEYKNISAFIKRADYILKKNDKNLVYFKINGSIYQFVIKKTQEANELFITTFHKASNKQLAKDLKRYVHIKTDSSDCEDSKYPSVT